ncbi:unnamed protein product [Hermetia illucens]|uniref:Uncharacterized protein n=1 Tax=Hermetia illucens TaxID=343691 RepID=A0A7R8ULJ3_HERIL|nr:uncharacterized protein LOC119649682 [Hermetia illucens]CAD7082704.1 unnamed protein product [Hermetia illucens]
MFKLIVLTTLCALAAAKPGLISPLWGGIHAPILAPGIIHDPLAIAAPLSLAPSPIIAAHSPIIAAPAPLISHAPIITAHAPLSAAIHHPLLIKK